MEIKIGIIGCGGIAMGHITRLLKIKGVKFVGMCDINENSAKKYASLYGGNFYTDFRKMFDKEKIDACYICVPPFAHIGQEEECIERNIPFFIEKPIHLNLDKAKEIAKKVKEKKLITSVGYILRYFDIVDQLKERMKDEQIGLIVGKYYSASPSGGWLIKKDMSGGQLIEQATHTVDLMRYLCGEVEEIFAYKFEGVNNKIYSEYNVEDALSMLMRFKNGIIGNLRCSWLWRDFDTDIEILGKYVVFNYKGNTITINKGIKIEQYISKMDPMYEEDLSFIKSIKENNPKYIKSDYNDALKTLEITIKAHESIEKNQPIKLKE